MFRLFLNDRIRKSLSQFWRYSFKTGDMHWKIVFVGSAKKIQGVRNCFDFMLSRVRRFVVLSFIAYL